MTGQLLFLASRPDRGLRAFLVVAQRRPGPRPRRHTMSSCVATMLRNAQRRPGPRPRRHEAREIAAVDPDLIAQRRPGPRPRRHLQHIGRDDAVALRSTKAGAETPATPPSRSSRCHRRSPAQRRPGPRPRRHMTAVRVPSTGCSAQRRPGPRPRRHCAATSLSNRPTLRAQRRPGPRPRRHRQYRRRPVTNSHRSTKAGAETPATLQFRVL